MNLQDDPKLAVARKAAALFVEHGVAATSGEDIAAAAGISKRTLWRYFRTKEASVAPLFARTSLQFANRLEDWPKGFALEEYLADCLALDFGSSADIADGILVVRLLARLPQEPDLRAVWLFACHEHEALVARTIAGRLERAVSDYEIRLCAAAVMAAIRTVDETISLAAIAHGQVFTGAEIAARLAEAIRAASTLDFCDPVIPDVFGDGGAKKALRADAASPDADRR